MLEKIIAKVILPCEYDYLGCVIEGNKDELQEHEKNCAFQELKAKETIKEAKISSNSNSSRNHRIFTQSEIEDYYREQGFPEGYIPITLRRPIY